MTNLCDVLEEVKEMVPLMMLLDVPMLKWEEIQDRYSNNTQRKRAIVEYFIHNHPAASWEQVVESLYVFHDESRYHGVLQNLIGKYLKRKKLSHTTGTMHHADDKKEPKYLQ